MRSWVLARATVVFLACLALPAPATAWGFEAHKAIAEHFIALLPSELRPLFEARKAFIVERSIDPDVWRTVGWESEPPHHFVDIDFYGKFPFTELPHEYDRAVQKFGREVVDAQGTLPWRTEEFYGRLEREFAGLKRKPPPAYATDNIVLFSAILAHYVSDGHVPLHAVMNYDGQLTSQQGVHSRWEAELFERNRSRIKIAPLAPRPVIDPREFMFQTLLDSYKLAEGVLQSDRKAAQGREFYDDGYFEVLAKEQLAVLERRLNDSITAVASVVIGAWQQAGHPAIPVERSRQPRPIRPPN
ncbi:MAG TPA: hypothetical protein VEK56_03160 [Vicinamibacterales bacterium]|nr:hypothetical protein [Vicinamibacterales bacterium]